MQRLLVLGLVAACIGSTSAAGASHASPLVGGEDMLPWVSPDGEGIAFARVFAHEAKPGSGDEGSFVTTVRLASVSGGATRFVGYGVAGGWSSDGRWLAATLCPTDCRAAKSTALVLVSRDGSRRRTLARHVCGWPAWLQGTLVAYARCSATATEIRAIGSDRRGDRLLARLRSRQVAFLEASPVGARVLASSGDRSWVVAASGAVTAVRLSDGAQVDGWMPDGAHLLVQATVPSAPLTATALDGSSSEPLVLGGLDPALVQYAIAGPEGLLAVDAGGLWIGRPGEPAVDLGPGGLDGPSSPWLPDGSGLVVQAHRSCRSFDGLDLVRRDGTRSQLTLTCP